MTYIELALLGMPRIERDGVAIQMETRKAVALLAYLAVRGDACGRDTLASLLWPESDGLRARNALRYTLSKLRKALGEEWFHIDREMLALNWAADIRVDVRRFHHLLTVAQDEASPNGTAALIEAVALYRADFLAGFTLVDSSTFDDWQFFEAESLRQSCARSLEALVGVLAAQHAYASAIEYARRWVAFDPLHEPAQRQLMWLYAQDGQRVAAQRQYEACLRLLQAELGAVPAPETTELYEQIGMGTLPLVARGGGTPTLEEGAAGATPHNLPAQATAFVGREEDLGALAALLADPACRLVTLVAPGGSGKTRLALQLAAEQLPHFKDGVFYVDLTPLAAPDSIVPTIADSLGLVFQGQKEPLAQLLASLRDQTMLLLLDNFEHLMAGAELVSDLLSHAPHLKILVTSREALSLYEEQRYLVEGLAVPRDTRAAASTAFSALRLFDERARQVRPDFVLAEEQVGVVCVCQLVEGLPLAIELAAVWVKLLPCLEIAAEIARNLDFLTTTHRNVPPRHRSLRAVFEGSWALLTAEEQRVLAHLSIFRGGFTRGAALRVVGASLLTLSALVDKCLLRRVAEERYAIHELVRQYAAEKLGGEAEAEERVRVGHCDYYAALLEESGPLWDSPREAEAIERVRAELQNVVWGWQRACTGRTAALEKYIDPLYDFLTATNRFAEGRELFRQATAALMGLPGGERAAVPPALLGKLLARQAEFCYTLGALDEATTLLQRSLPLAAGEAGELALVHKLAGLVAHNRGHYTDAIQHLQLGLEAARHVHHPARCAQILLALGAVGLALGSYEQARAWLAEALAINREIGKQLGLAFTLRLLGEIAFAEGRHEEVIRLQQQSLALFEANHHALGMALGCLSLGQTAQAQGRLDEAERWYQRGLSIARDEDNHMLLVRVLNRLGELAREQGAYGVARGHLEEALAIATASNAVPVALQTFLGMSEVMADEITQVVDEQQPEAGGLIEEGAKLFHMLAFLTNHPSSTHQTRRQAQFLLSDFKAALPPGVVHEIQRLADSSGPLLALPAPLLPHGAAG